MMLIHQEDQRFHPLPPGLHHIHAEPLELDHDAEVWLLAANNFRDAWAVQLGLIFGLITDGSEPAA